jgi:MFS family permease
MNRLALLSVGRAGTCLGTMAFAGALPVLRTAWHMDASTAGAIQTAFNLSNAVALLAAAWLCDSIGAKRVYLVCTWTGALALACFAMFARSAESALFLIVFVGLTQGGAYAPALLLAAELSPSNRRGKAMGQMLAAGSLGYMLSVFLALAMTRSFGPAAGFGACAVGALIGASVGHVSLAGHAASVAVHHAHATSRTARMPWRSVFGPASVCLLIGYVAHCWELLGSWAWTPSLLASALQPYQMNATASALLIAAIIHLSGVLSTALVGTLSDTWPRATVLVVVGGAGAVCSMLMGLSAGWGAGWTLAFAAIGSFFILGDSGVLSAAMTDEVPPGSLGRVMGVRSMLGFGSGALAPITFGATLDATHRWSWAYFTLAIGGALACAAALRLQAIGTSKRKAAYGA